MTANAVPDVRHASAGAPGAALDAVTKRWGAVPVLDRVTFEFTAGVTYVVSGRSGAGKTTLLNLLAGYLEPDEGAARVTGPVGYLFQDDILFSGLTAWDNVLLRAAVHSSRDEVAGAVRRCLEAVGMARRGDERVSVLSGGERQRVQLATVLAGSPGLVLLDEPTASLDPQTRGEVAQLLAEVFAQVTCVIVSHDERLADEIGDVERLVLESGELSRA